MRQDLTGQQFGRLMVIAREENRKGKQYYRCLCACGKETVVEASHLKGGHTRSCGCYRKEKGKEKAQDLTGRRCGRLLVLGPALSAENADPSWICRCDCGNQVTVKGCYLMNGTTRSCGCLQKEQRKENKEKAIHFADGTCVERIASRKTFSNNTTGHRGVYRRKNNRWRACIGFQGKVYHLGNFSNYEDAVKARLEAENRLYDTFLEEYAKKKDECAFMKNG